MLSTSRARADFAVLGYPVISMVVPPITHPGSRKALIGETPTAERQRHYSPEQNVTPQTPPTFFFHAVDDPSVPVDNAPVMFNALRAQQVPTELHLFAEGKHGFGIRGTTGLPAAEWPQLAMNWIASLAGNKNNAETWLAADAPAGLPVRKLQ